MDYVLLHSNIENWTSCSVKKKMRLHLNSMNLIIVWNKIRKLIHANYIHWKEGELHKFLTSLWICNFWAILMMLENRINSSKNSFHFIGYCVHIYSKSEHVNTLWIIAIFDININKLMKLIDFLNVLIRC